jgi:hypothetical protein
MQKEKEKAKKPRPGKKNFFVMTYSFYYLCMHYIILKTDSLISQQRLPTWQPIIHFGTVYPLLVGIGIVIFIIGIALVIVEVNHEYEIKINYSERDECIACKNELKIMHTNCSSCIAPANLCTPCTITFSVTEEQKLKVMHKYIF